MRLGNINLLLTIAILSILGGCSQKPSAETLAVLKAADQVILRSDTLLDDLNRRSYRMLEAERKNEPERMSKLISLYGKVQGFSNDLDYFLESLQFDSNLTHSALLKNKLTAYKKEVLLLMNNYPMPEDIPVDTNTAYCLSQSMPEAARILAVHKLRNDIRFTERCCLLRLSKEIYDYDFLSKPYPIIAAHSATIEVGDTFQTVIGLGEYLSGFNIEVYVDGKLLPTDTSFRTLYSVKATKSGKCTVPILIRFPKRSGGYEEFKDELRYTVLPDRHN